MDSKILPAPYHRVSTSGLRRIALEKNEVLFRQGDAADGVFFLVSGNVELRRHTENGDVVLIHKARADETFAEASLFSEFYHCDAVCGTRTEALFIAKKEIRDLFENDRDFSLALAKRFAGQVQGYRRRVEILAIRSADERVLDAIRDGLLQSDIKTFSQTIGLTQEATYRALAALVRSGQLTKKGRGKYRLS